MSNASNARKGDTVRLVNGSDLGFVSSVSRKTGKAQVYWTGPLLSGFAPVETLVVVQGPLERHGSRC